MNDPNSVTELPNGHDPELEELVAYLDGELESDRAQEIEQRLVSDPNYRTRLQELERTWEMLDWLPRSQTSPKFTQTTVELVAVQAEREVAKGELRDKRQRRSGQLLVVVATLAVCFAGFGLVWNWQQADERQLLRDYPLIEELDMYRNADSVEFLRRLEQHGLFTETEEVADESL